MKVVRPVAVTDAVLLSSDAPEIDYAVYAAGTTYAVGAMVIRTQTHRCYESLVAGNIAHTPETSPNQWLDIGPTNRWAMFDDRVGTSTVQATSLTVQLMPGAIDSLALLDTSAETVHVTMTVAGTVVYDRTASFNVGGAPIVDWFSYFFEPVGRKSVLILADLPVFPNGQITVVISAGGSGANVSVGTMIVGSTADLGLTETSPQVGIIDYSKKTTDQFGVTQVVERAWSKRMTTRAQIGTDQVDAVDALLASLRARPVLWLGEDGFDSLTVFGFYKDFSIDIAYETVSYCSLTIEGLT